MDKKHEGGTVQVEILHRGHSDPALQKSSKTFCTVAPFMVQISPKYFHSQEPQAHITFNLSQIFKTHLSTFLLKVPLTPELWLPLFNLSPNINQK